MMRVDHLRTSCICSPHIYTQFECRTGYHKRWSHNRSSVMTTCRFTMASSSGNTIASGRSFGGMCWTNKKFACPSIIRTHECALHSCVVSVHARPLSYLCILCTHTETIFYGDACPVIAGNETIKFDDFEMDQTSVRRTLRCVVLSVQLRVAYQAHTCNCLLCATCNCLVCAHHVLYQVGT